MMKPMTSSGEERDFDDKFEVVDAMALGQMSRARAAHVLGSSFKNHDPRSTRISDLTKKERKSLRGSKEYNNLKSGIGQQYTYFWNNHEQSHHMKHLESLVRIEGGDGGESEARRGQGGEYCGD